MYKSLHIFDLFWFVTKLCIAAQLSISIFMLWAPHRDGGDLLHPAAPEIQFTTWSCPGWDQLKSSLWIHLLLDFNTWRPGLLHVRFFIDASQVEGVAFTGHLTFMKSRQLSAHLFPDTSRFRGTTSAHCKKSRQITNRKKMKNHMDSID